LSTQKERKHFYLDKNSIDYINQFAEKNNLRPSKALQQIILEHSNQNQELLELIKKAVKEVVQEDLSRIRAGTNLADRHSRMILEFMNHYFVVKKHQELITTEKVKSRAIIEAEQVVKNQIAEARQRKLEWEQKRQLHE